jgi:uncharacterized glyoxalase superfamily protein PhnB
MSKARITHVAPILLVADIIKATDYYRDQLGFDYIRLYGEPPNFAIIARDDCRIMLARADDPSGILPNWKIQSKTSSIYFWVEDIDALYAEYQSSGAEIDYMLYTTPWGIREFGVQDIDGYDISFGQPVTEANTVS